MPCHRAADVIGQSAIRFGAITFGAIGRWHGRYSGGFAADARKSSRERSAREIRTSSIMPS